MLLVEGAVKLNCLCGHSQAAHQRTGSGMCAFCSCGSFSVEATSTTPVQKKEPSEVEDALARLLEQPPFVHVAVGQIRSLTDRGHRRVILRDAVLMDTGEASDRIYFLLHGKVAVYRPAKGPLAELDVTLGPGDIVGEVGFLHGAKHTAKVVALDDLRVLEFSSEDVHAVFQEHPAVRMAFQRLAHQRLQELLGHAPEGASAES
jgi:CRP-like cAMP-binding protein